MISKWGRKEVALFLLSVLSGFVNPPIFAEDSSANTLTLEQSKKIAVERNANLAAIKARSEAAKARQGRAAAGFYPTLETKLGSEQGLAGKPEQASTFGYLVARWNIYHGGLDVAGTKTSTLEAKQAELDYELERLSVENAVEEVFSNLLYLRDVSAIKERFIEINGQQQALARQVVARGSGSESDVVEFDLRTATLKSELAQIEQDYQGYLVKLKSLIGEDIAKNPTPTGELPHQHLQGSLADYANPNLTEAPQVKAAALDLDIASHKASAAKGRWLPQVDVEGRFGSLPLSDGGEKGKLGSSVALVATWEIFGGFDASYEAKERLADKAQADWRLKADINALLTDIRVQFGELVSIQKRIDREKDNIKTARRYYELVFADFKRGYKNSGDFSAAAKAWYDAEVQRKRLDLEFVEKKITLELKLGKRIATSLMKDVEEGAGDKK